ncbi:MAG: hypothetical protein WC533_00860 [Candidatus Pacearchaeota archaeon]
MAEPEYGVIEPGTIEPGTIIKVPHKQKPIVVSVFGPNGYLENVKEMRRHFSCLPYYTDITFRPATTSESISASVYDFKNLARPRIFDSEGLQIGRITRTSEGVFANALDENSNPIVDESVLKNLLNECKNINGIWLYQGDNPNLRDFGFAPYDTFKQSELDAGQDAGDFVEEGLARVLEHTEGCAVSLQQIASRKNYSMGVGVDRFDSVKEPVQRVASLSSGWGNMDIDWLAVGGDNRDMYDDGYAFGVLEKDAEGVAKNF